MWRGTHVSVKLTNITVRRNVRLQSLAPVAGLRTLPRRHKLGWHVVYLVSLTLTFSFGRWSHTITGTGEYITRSGLARALGKAFEALPNAGDCLEGVIDPHATIQKVLEDEFWSESTADRVAEYLSKMTLLTGTLNSAQYTICTEPSRDLGVSSPSAGILLMTYEDGDDNQPIGAYGSCTDLIQVY